MHIANAMGTKVLGLHAASNPARSGPYCDRRYCVDRYDEAARKYLGKPAAELRWGTKIEHDGVMDLITVDDAIAAFERYCADHLPPRAAACNRGDDVMAAWFTVVAPLLPELIRAARPMFTRGKEPSQIPQQIRELQDAVDQNHQAIKTLAARDGTDADGAEAGVAGAGAHDRRTAPAAGAAGTAAAARRRSWPWWRRPRRRWHLPSPPTRWPTAALTVQPRRCPRAGPLLRQEAPYGAAPVR